MNWFICRYKANRRNGTLMLSIDAIDFAPEDTAYSSLLLYNCSNGLLYQRILGNTLLTPKASIYTFFVNDSGKY